MTSDENPWIEAFRVHSVGSDIYFLGKKMVVTAHYKTTVVLGTICGPTCIVAEYLDNNGVIHEKRFYDPCHPAISLK